MSGQVIIITGNRFDNSAITEFVIDPPIEVGAGGQTVFNTVKDAVGSIDMFENGVNNIIRVVNKTANDEVTTTTLVPQGTTVVLKYLALL